MTPGVPNSLTRSGARRPTCAPCGLSAQVPLGTYPNRSPHRAARAHRPPRRAWRSAYAGRRIRIECSSLIMTLTTSPLKATAPMFRGAHNFRHNTFHCARSSLHNDYASNHSPASASSGPMNCSYRRHRSTPDEPTCCRTCHRLGVITVRRVL